MGTPVGPVSISEAADSDSSELEQSDPGSKSVVAPKMLEPKHNSVAVVGEAKSGKSSFINALIGQPLLPTDVDIATSQGFLVTKARRSGYRLRFEDDSTQMITAEDLPRYGSYGWAGKAGISRSDWSIRWIEVDVPALYLPDGVSLLDTPGLGLEGFGPGLPYAASHGVTWRLIRQAKSVIYVLNSTGPIMRSELETIGAILDVPARLFFIQTRIDQFPRDLWQSLQVRNETRLREHFGARIADPKVWPISSVYLMQAAEGDKRDFWRVSRYPELAVALETFLFEEASCA